MKACARPGSRKDKSRTVSRSMSALGPKGEVTGFPRHVRFSSDSNPKSDVATLRIWARRPHFRGPLRLTALVAGALAAGTSRQDQPSRRVSGEGKQLGISFLEFFVSGFQCANQTLRFAGEGNCKISSRISWSIQLSWLQSAGTEDGTLMSPNDRNIFWASRSFPIQRNLRRRLSVWSSLSWSSDTCGDFSANAS